MEHLRGQDNLSLNRLGCITTFGEVREERRPERTRSVAELDGLGLGVDVVQAELNSRDTCRVLKLLGQEGPKHEQEHDVAARAEPAQGLSPACAAATTG